MSKDIAVRCPMCKKSFSYYQSESRPFCSERCKLIDLGKWAGGEYSLKSLTPLDEEDMETVVSRYEEGSYDE